jgi:G:T-mismatch repair DNA endonuclease (very short patch repair protein)
MALPDMLAREAERNHVPFRSKNTKGEIIVRKYLHRLVFRFRLHDPTFPESRMLSFLNINALFLSMDAFGMLIRMQILS